MKRVIALLFVLTSMIFLTSSCSTQKISLPSNNDSISTDPNTILNYWDVTQYGDWEGRNSMFYTLNSSDGKLIVIDGGWPHEADIVKEAILSHGGIIDLWILTHPHLDHIGAFMELYSDTDIQINKVCTVKMAPVELAFERAPWDDMGPYENFLTIDDSDYQYLYVGDSLQIGNLDIQILNAYDDYVAELSNDLLNDGSLVFKVSVNDQSMLFCADVGNAMSEFLITKYGEELQADYLQMPHHGFGGLSHDFYRLVNPQVAFFDAPEFLIEDTTGNYNTPENVKFMERLGCKIFSFKTTPNTIRLQ